MRSNWGGEGGSCHNNGNYSNYRRVEHIKCFLDRVRKCIVNVLTIHYEMYSDKY